VFGDVLWEGGWHREVTSATNQIALTADQHNITSIDSDGEVLAFGPMPSGSVPGWWFIKANNCYMIANGVYTANPTAAS
jgi:hypothetical protein